MTDEQIAEICHEANRAYCKALGDESQLPWATAPQWQRDSAVNGVRFHRAAPSATDAASHEHWLREKQRAGWTYGPVKDEAKKQHPCMVPFRELPPAQQRKDALFRKIVSVFIETAQGETAGAVNRILARRTSRATP